MEEELNMVVILYKVAQVHLTYNVRKAQAGEEIIQQSLQAIINFPDALSS